MSQPPQRPRSQRDLIAPSDILAGFLQDGKHPLSAQFLRFRVWKQWPEILGETLAEVSEPVGYNHGELLIWVKSPSWSHHLKLISPQIKQKLNDFVGEAWVKRITFTQNGQNRVSQLDKEPSV